MSAFPEHFAILRTLSSRGPSWQLFQSKYICSGLRPSECFYKIIPYTRAGIDEVIYSEDQSWTTQKSVSLRTQDGELLVQKYCILPMILYIGNSEFPIVEFEYKAWLPKPSSRSPVSNHIRVLQAYNDCMRRIHRVDRRLFDDLPRRPPTPPHFSRPVSPISTVSDDAHSVISIFPGYHSLDFPALPPSPVSISPPVSSKPLPIPELVGMLLIQNAKTSEDACPISTIPFKELTSLTATSCFHVFDTESIQTWLKQHRECPICRNSVSNFITKELKN